MKIFIDGDGSPTKKETMQVANHYGIPVVLVTSIDHYSNKDTPDFVETVYVDQGADAADFKIMSLLSPGDTLVTQDYGLASLAMAKATVIHQSGMVYTEWNIDRLLAQRYEGQQMRKHKIHTKGPKPFTDEDRKHFVIALTKLIENA